MKAAPVLFPLLTLTALAATAPSPLPGGWQGKLAAMLPLPGQNAVLLARGTTVNIVELGRRVATVGGDRAAYEDLLAEVSRGADPEYNERLGISREEFKRYLVFQPTLVATTKTVRLPVTRDSARVMFGDVAGLGGVLKGVSIDLRSGDMTTPEGFTAKIAAYKPNPTDRTLDVRSGFQWKIRDNDIKTFSGINGTLNLWLLGSGQIVLTYERNSMIRNVTSKGEIMLGYTR